MKGIAFILSVIITVTTFMPYFCNDCDNCASVTQCNTNDCAQDNCPDCCSPFQLCGTCFGFIVSYVLSVDKTIYFQLSEVHVAYTSAPLSEFYDSIWHPPAFA